MITDTRPTERLHQRSASAAERQQTDKTPTLTIMTLALRQADFIAAQRKRGDL